MWAPKWRSQNRIDGRREYLMTWEHGKPRQLFATRAECRKWIKENYGYILEREDLRREPHGWRQPMAVRVEVVQCLV